MSNKNTYSGQLDTRIKIIENTSVTSATGEKDKAQVILNSYWAKVEDISGNEDIEGKIIALNVRRYTIRYSAAIAAKQITDLIIDDDGEQFNIHSTAKVGRKEYLILKCSKTE